jgi:glycosyltransferase involved in cell wall biosynthesis
MWHKQRSETFRRRVLMITESQRHMATRLALGLTRAAYAAADVIAPVTEANAAWERGLGVDPDRIRVIANGISSHQDPALPPDANRVVAIGRIDPLKDVQTMLLVATEVCRRLPRARFECWGPPTPGQEVYAMACERKREQLGLGTNFRFMGRTTDPHSVIRGADVVLMTSISEGMPMTLLEAMSQARPTVATGVGGIPGVIRGCGIVAPPGDVHGLAMAIVTLLRNPELAATLGRRGYARLNRRYTLEHCVEGYRALIDKLIGGVPRGAAQTLLTIGSAGRFSKPPRPAIGFLRRQQPRIHTNRRHTATSVPRTLSARASDVLPVTCSRPRSCSKRGTAGPLGARCRLRTA